MRSAPGFPPLPGSLYNAAALTHSLRIRQCNGRFDMHVLLIVSSKDPEIKWNAVRFGNVLLNEGEDVSLFLNGPASAFYDGDCDALPIREQLKMFVLSEGDLHA